MKLGEYMQTLNSKPSVDPSILALAQANPNNESIQSLVLQSYLSSIEDQKKQQQQQQMMQVLGIGGEQPVGMYGAGTGGQEWIQDPSTGQWIRPQEYQVKQEPLASQYTLPDYQTAGGKTGGSGMVGSGMMNSGKIGLGLLKGIVQPGIEGPKWIGEGGRYLAGAAINAIKNPDEDIWKYGERYDPIFYGKKEWNEVSQNPEKAIETGVKRGLGIASYIPMALGGATATTAPGRIGQMGSRGFASGVLGSSGMTDEDLGTEKQISQALGSGMIGFGLGAGGQAVGEGIGALATKAKYGVTDVMKPIREGDLVAGQPVLADEVSKTVTTQRPMNRLLQEAEIITNRQATPQGYQRLLELKSLGIDSGQIDIPIMETADELTKQYGDDFMRQLESGSPMTSLQEKGVNIQARAKGLKTPAEPLGTQKVNESFTNAREVVSSKGEKMNPNGIAKTFNKLKGDLDGVIKASDVSVPRQQIVDEAVNNVTLNYDISEDKARKIVETAITRLGGGEDIGLSTQALASIKKGAYPQAQKVLYSTNPSNTLKAEAALHDIVDSVLKTSVPEASPIYTQMAYLHEIAPDIIKNADKSGYFTSAFVGNVRVPLPVQGVISGAQGLYGKGLESVGGKLGSAPSVMGKMAGPLGSAAPYMGSVGVALGGAASSGPSLGVPSSTLEMSDTSEDTAPLGITNMETAGSGLNTDMLAYLVMSGQMDSATAKYIQELYGGGTSGGKPLPAGSLKTLSEVRESLNLLNTLQSQFDESKGAFGPITGQVRGIIPWDNTSQKAKATIALVKQIIAKGLEGGVLRKEDEYKYKEILPKLGDTDATVQNKIDLLNTTLQNKYNTQVETYQGGGYDPFSGLGAQ